MARRSLAGAIFAERMSKNPGSHRGGPGRPPKEAPKYTPVTERRILRGLKAGNTLRATADSAGIDRDTLRRWMDQGETDHQAGRDTEKSRLYGKIKKAMAVPVLANVARIQRAAQGGTWTAAAWWLERRHPEEWGKPPERLEVSTPLPLQFVFQLPDGTERPLTVGKPPPSLPP